MKRSILIYLVFLFVATLNAQVKTVIVEGEGMGKDDAVYSALRLAVEQVGGVQIQSSSATKDFALVSDVILAEAKGFVTSFDILNQKNYGDGVTWVRIRATVDASGIPGRMSEIAGLLKMKGYPKILVDVPETIDGQYNSQRIFEQKIKRYLKKKESRMNIIIHQDMDANQQREVQIAREKGDKSYALQMARRKGYEVVIRGDSRIYKVKELVIRGQKKIVYNASVVADAVRVDTSFLIATAEVLKSNSWRGMAPSGAEVGQELLRLAGEDFAKKMIGRIIKDWIDDVNRFTHGTLFCTGIEFGDLEIIETHLGTYRGIQGVQQKDYDDDQAEFQFQLKGKASKLAKHLNKLQLDSGKILKVKSVKGNVIRAKGDFPR